MPACTNPVAAQHNPPSLPPSALPATDSGGHQPAAEAPARPHPPPAAVAARGAAGGRVAAGPPRVTERACFMDFIAGGRQTMPASFHHRLLAWLQPGWCLFCPSGWLPRFSGVYRSTGQRRSPCDIFCPSLPSVATRHNFSCPDPQLYEHRNIPCLAYRGPQPYDTTVDCRPPCRVAAAPPPACPMFA